MDTKKTILVVDDDPAIIALLSEVFTAEGYNVVTANNPSLAVMKTENIDLIILDLNLSDDSSLEGNKILCHLWVDKTFNTPIIVFSGYVGKEEGKKNIEHITNALGNGRTVFRCIQKGQSIKVLLQAVSDCFKEIELKEIIASA